MDEPGGLTGEQWRRAWRIITWAGFLGSTYYLLCVSGAPRVKYLTTLGATPLDFGVISMLGAMALTFQLLGGLLSSRVARRKPVWIALALAHRLVFLGLLAAPFLPWPGQWRIGWVFVVLFSHDALAQTSGPIWLSWMADLVPKESMSRHWATRQRSITAASIVIMVLIAFGFHYFETTNRVILGFTLIGCLGVVVGVIDILMFFAVPEPLEERPASMPWNQILLQPIRDRSFRRFLVYMGYWHFAVFLAAPFFGLYLLEEVGFSVRTVQLLGTASALGVVLSSYFWGLVCDVYGYRPVLQMLSAAKMFTPAAYLFAPRSPGLIVPYFVAVWFIDGVLNSGMALAFQGPLLKFTPQRNRTMYIGAANFLAIGVMASIAPALSGYLIKSVGTFDLSWTALGTFSGYHVAFGLSLVMRASASWFAGRIIEPAASTARSTARQAFTLDSFRASKWAHRLHNARDEHVRARATEVLARLKNPLAVGVLSNALRDPSLAVRNGAVSALDAIGSTQATAALAAALFDSHSGIQSPAARALGHIGGVDSLRALVRYLHSGDRGAVADTLDSLAAIGDDAAILPLIYLFNEVPDDGLRQRIAAALARLSQANSLEEVLDLLRARGPLAPPIPQ